MACFRLAEELKTRLRMAARNGRLGEHYSEAVCARECRNYHSDSFHSEGQVYVMKA
jgi:hypothetical protein